MTRIHAWHSLSALVFLAAIAAMASFPRGARAEPSSGVVHAAGGYSHRVNGRDHAIWARGMAVKLFLGKTCLGSSIASKRCEANKRRLSVGVLGSITVFSMNRTDVPFYKDGRSRGGQTYLGPKAMVDYDLGLSVEYVFPDKNEEIAFLVASHVGLGLWASTGTRYIAPPCPSDRKPGSRPYCGAGTIGHSAEFGLSTGLRLGFVIATGKRGTRGITLQGGADFRAPVFGFVEVQPVALIGYRL